MSQKRFINRYPSFIKTSATNGDIETVASFGLPLDTTPAAMSALFVAEAEDELIFNGNPEMGIDGLLTVPGRSTVGLTSDWSEEG
ncbi:MAG TPA: bacteriocin family protein, partial [Firmicutes bacterium]|nr:bacteriocin family protein [Bacillota bacterium]